MATLSGMTKPTRSGSILLTLLQEAKAGNQRSREIVRQMRAVVERSMLYRYSTGRRCPDVDTAAKLHAASDGLVAANGWVAATEAPKCRRSRKAA